MSNKGLITQDSLSWTRMKMNNRLFICDGKFQNMIQSVKTRIGKMIERIKTDMTGLSGTNKAIYVLGMIFKSLSIIQAGKSSVEMVREAKKLNGYCTDVSEFMGAMNQSMEGQDPSVRETVAEATNKFGGESKGYAKKLTALNLIWKALKPALIWISGYTLQKAAVESKSMVPKEEAPAQLVKTDSARRIRLGGKAKEKANRFRGLEMDKATIIRRARDSYCKSRRAHKDFFLAYALLAKGIGKYLSNEQLIRDILYGNIKEDNFVRKFINTYVDQIDYQVKNGGYAQEIVQEKQDFKNKLLRARTIKDLLRIFPNNPGLVRIDKMFMEARKRASR